LDVSANTACASSSKHIITVAPLADSDTNVISGEVISRLAPSTSDSAKALAVGIDDNNRPADSSIEDVSGRTAQTGSSIHFIVITVRVKSNTNSVTTSNPISIIASSAGQTIEGLAVGINVIDQDAFSTDETVARRTGQTACKCADWSKTSIIEIAFTTREMPARSTSQTKASVEIISGTVGIGIDANTVVEVIACDAGSADEASVGCTMRIDDSYTPANSSN
jgi:hypothetical protein